MKNSSVKRGRPQRRVRPRELAKWSGLQLLTCFLHLMLSCCSYDVKADNSEIMKNVISAGLIVLLASSMMLSCDKDKDEVMIGPVEIKLTQEQRGLLDGANSFGLELFREILADEESDKNVFISPLSAHLALAMTWNGADGNTRKQMTDVLRLPGGDGVAVNSSFKKLMGDLLSVDKMVELSIANSIWYRLGLSLEKDFLDINRKYFTALVESLDFGDPASLEIINGWVKENTRGKIETIIDEIRPNDMMYLINAIYFKGIWMQEFVGEKTRMMPFHYGSRTWDVMTMETEGSFGYARYEGYQVAELLYGQGNYGLLVFLPDENTGIDEMIEKFGPDEWKSLSYPLPAQNLNVRLPRFTFEYELDLEVMLVRMGMVDAFGPANFCRMSCGLFIDRVIHKTFVEVNEEGTEAAAVTAVIMVRINNPGTGIEYFHVNRPFVFAIREKYTNSLIFIGRVVDPG
jgi:serine protease inhibitor